MNGARATADIVEKPTSMQIHAVQRDGPAGKQITSVVNLVDPVEMTAHYLV